MQRISQSICGTLLFWTLTLSACSAPVVSPATVSPPTVSPTTTEVPSIPQDCGYQWANQDLPELSKGFQESIQTLQPEAQANAFAFGENCIRADGSIAGFSAMETDFNVTLQVDNLTNADALGEWIVKVMEVIKSVPPDQIVGPRPGRVSIAFRSNADQKFVNFYVNQYQDLPSGLSNSEIFQALQVPQ